MKIFEFCLNVIVEKLDTSPVDVYLLRFDKAEESKM